MSWLRIFEAYRDLEAAKIAAEARAEFLQDQNSQLLAQIEKLDDRAQAASGRLLEDREKIADMFAMQVLGEGVYDPSRQHPTVKRAQESGGLGAKTMPGPQRVPAQVIARDLARKAWAEDTQRQKQEQEAILAKAAAELGVKIEEEGQGTHAQTSAG